jgi:hypothetical protein
VQSLFDDLLISVTSFFRDPAAWQALRVAVISPLVESAEPNQAIRAWVPASAHGLPRRYFRDWPNHMLRYARLAIFLATAIEDAVGGVAAAPWAATAAAVSPYPFWLRRHSCGRRWHWR